MVRVPAISEDADRLFRYLKEKAGKRGVIERVTPMAEEFLGTVVGGARNVVHELVRVGLLVKLRKKGRVTTYSIHDVPYRISSKRRKVLLPAGLLPILSELETSAQLLLEAIHRTKDILGIPSEEL